MRGRFAAFFSQTPRAVSSATWLSKRKLVWNCSKPARSYSHKARQVSSGSNNAYSAGEFDGHCSYTFGNKDTPRNSCNSCVGNNRNTPDTRNSCTCKPDNRIRPQLLRFRLKPERQPVLSAPRQVRLLPMEVKEVFSWFFLLLQFCLLSGGMKAPVREFIDTLRLRSPF